MGESKYDLLVKPNLDYVAALIRDGRTEQEIADRLKISRRSLNYYRKQHKELEALFAQNRERVDLVNAVGAYYRLVTGYTVTEETRHYKMIDGAEQLVDRYVKEKYIPPNPNCTENWIRARLKNDEVWGSFAEDTRKNIVAADMDSEEGGVIFVPQKIVAAEAKIIEEKVTEVHE